MLNTENFKRGTMELVVLAVLRERDLYGYEIIKEVSERSGIPVAYTSGKKEFLDAFLAEGHDPKYIGTPVPIDVYMKRDWDSWVKTV